MRLNVGSGVHPLLNWVNLDSSPSAYADIYVSVPPIPYSDGELDEIYAGHFLEHLEREEADEFLEECFRSLKSNGRLGIVVPDTKEVLRRYINRDSARIEFPLGKWRDLTDLDEVCDLFLYSTAQESPHQWSYDKVTLTRLLAKHRFKVVNEINRWMDPRIPVGAWYQFGLDAIKE